MRSNSGFTILEIMIAVTIIGFLCGLAIPAFMKVRVTTQAKACVDNLRQIANYKEMWAMESFAKTGDPCVRGDVTPFFKRGFPICPAGGDYDVGLIGDPPTCTRVALGHVLQ